ncbi:MAG TPA: peptide-methionine (R)-S-oxide reductase MsrB [Saprospiraceae bacterium]|nr:peptide-methionine (R)-S-oxide reductase MsrB [Saprospiraceae bacterium]HPG06996.1 peptide-methionine (R)-S-oxide reductase MsrB [Saprospiraceae bacterium]HPR00197.1 peptide-methionine (R)-S-oxide reductase MsrB [Saprospiraceae bacterium]HQU53384.1 peptide-methionine (R)-S-oxide reductase MsrB [Saprospiraceae bacterium]HRV85341.1 peptide-methionine (R)-S-oxide reductase MsrB [Saprospiraceae bacterium]
MKNSIALFVLIAFAACQPKQHTTDYSVDTSGLNATEVSAMDTIKPIIKTDAEWKAALSPEEFYVLREKGTERAFTGDLWDYHGDGIFVCAACGLPLFDSKTKFESGTGWPSFYKPISPNDVKEERDSSLGMIRTEVLCARCGGHLGHVFNDGPRPTGLRYCMNSVSMNVIPRDSLTVHKP